jgi:hypothetical protein
MQRFWIALAQRPTVSLQGADPLESHYPNRFGTFAMLPLPHIDQSLKEIEYAFDTLKVDGVGCMTSYRDKWLGYVEFEPVWAELNRRKATVYTHPTGANCCVNLVRGADDPYVEFGTDTTRTIFTLIFGGVAQRYPDINWIFSHEGGSLTSFYERFTVQALATPPYRGKFSQDDVKNKSGASTTTPRRHPMKSLCQLLRRWFRPHRLSLVPTFRIGRRQITLAGFRHYSKETTLKR